MARGSFLARFLKFLGLGLRAVSQPRAKVAHGKPGRVAARIARKAAQKTRRSGR